MALLTPSSALANTILGAINTALNSGGGPGTLKIYTGTKPASPDDAATGTLLGTLTLSNTAGVVSARTLTFNTVTQDSSADATGTAAWGRFLDKNGTAVLDVDVSTTSGTAFIKMNTTSVVAGGPIVANSIVVTA